MAAILQAFMNGKWVEIPALQGEDGYSPTVTVADEGDKITITVEDKNGEKTISYAKGGGDMLKSVYDADGDGKVDQAEKADFATNASIASRANSAATADKATSATDATNAVNATKAANADKLGGELPSAYRKKADKIDYLTEVDNKPESGPQLTMEELLIMFPTGGWYNDVDAGTWFKTVSVDAYGNALDLNDATDKLFVDVKIPNLYKDEVRAAWAELRDFEITEDGLRVTFFAEPTVNITIDAVRLRKEG